MGGFQAFSYYAIIRRQAVEKKVKQFLYRPGQALRDPGPLFHDNLHMKVVRLSAQRTGRLYSSGNIPGTHLC